MQRAERGLGMLLRGLADAAEPGAEPGPGPGVQRPIGKKPKPAPNPPPVRPPKGQGAATRRAAMLGRAPPGTIVCGAAVLTPRAK